MDRDRVMALLRELDDPGNVEAPAGYRWNDEKRRFLALAADLERRFGGAGEVDVWPGVQDASYLGQITMPGPVPVFVRVSNFGRLALVGAERPGCYDDAETRILLGDAGPLLDAVSARGYVPLFEDVLNAPYDGPSPVDGPWFNRYFNVL